MVHFESKNFEIGRRPRGRIMGMAALIFRGKSKCSICGKVLAEQDDIVATTHFIEDDSDPLWRFSDSAMHRECFANWEFRDAFVAHYNATMGAITWGNGTYHEMQSNGTIEFRHRI